MELSCSQADPMSACRNASDSECGGVNKSEGSDVGRRKKFVHFVRHATA